MRFFPRGAFTERASIPAQIPVPQVLFQQLQPPVQQMQQLQQQFWQVGGMPVVEFPKINFAPESFFQVQKQILMQDIAMQLFFRLGPQRLDPQFVNKAPYITGMIGFGWPMF